MSFNGREKKLREQEETKTAKQFELLGRFVATFEGVMEQMRHLIALTLKGYGLANDELNEAMTVGLAAHDLSKLFNTVFALILKDHPNELLFSVAKDIRLRIKDLIEDRNNYVHGLWFGNPAEDATATLGIKLVHTAKGVAPRNLPSIQQLDERIDEAFLLLNVIHRVNLYVDSKFTFPLERHFWLDEKKNVVYLFTLS
jgi:hypothetical protein